MVKTLEAQRSVAIAINDIVSAAIQSAKELQEFRGASVQFIPDGIVQSEVVPQVIHTAVVNMLLNAAESHPKAKILVRLGTFPESNSFVIQVHDDGPGIPENLRLRVLEPHYTTKPFNSGMGLVAVNSTAHIHGGSIGIESSDNLGGACITLVIPQHPLFTKAGITGS